MEDQEEQKTSLVLMRGKKRICEVMTINKENKHNAEQQRTDPAQTLRANSVTRAVFSHLMPKIDFHYFHRFS